jgi:hypothetical protein
VTKEDDDGLCFGHDLSLIVRPRHLTRKFFNKVSRVSVSLLLFFLGTRTIVCVEYGLSAFQDGRLIRPLQPGSHENLECKVRYAPSSLPNSYVRPLSSASSLPL